MESPVKFDDSAVQPEIEVEPVIVEDCAANGIHAESVKQLARSTTLHVRGPLEVL